PRSIYSLIVVDRGSVEPELDSCKGLCDGSKAVKVTAGCDPNQAVLKGGVIRQELYYLLKDEKDVHFTFGSAGGGGIRKASTGMAASKFCLNIAGDTPSSNRLFDAIVSHCVPVIISDDIELPYEDILDYSKFSIFVPASDACKNGYLINLLRGVKREKWIEMWENLKQIAPHFEYQLAALSLAVESLVLAFECAFHMYKKWKQRLQHINSYLTCVRHCQPKELRCRLYIVSTLRLDSEIESRSAGAKV
ncbi:hypothetical protein M8C21_028700, partial [Ambrosia artemisiifolia]